MVEKVGYPRRRTSQLAITGAAEPANLRKPKTLSIIGLLEPHRKAMTLALAAVVVESGTELLEPWPLKIVIDYLLQGKQLPAWMMSTVGWIGNDKLAVLNFAVVAVGVIAAAGAASSYL